MQNISHNTTNPTTTTTNNNNTNNTNNTNNNTSYKEVLVSVFVFVVALVFTLALGTSISISISAIISISISSSVRIILSISTGISISISVSNTITKGMCVYAEGLGGRRRQCWKPSKSKMCEVACFAMLLGSLRCGLQCLTNSAQAVRVLLEAEAVRECNPLSCFEHQRGGSAAWQIEAVF